MRSRELDQLEREAFWRAHVDACQQHPGRQRDYCQQHGLIARELRKWRTHFYGPLRQQTGREASENLQEEGPREFSYARPPGSAQEVAVLPVIRRRWTIEQKRQLVWEGLNSGQPLSRFARQHGITPSAAYRWLREFARPVLTAPPPAAEPAFAEVQVAAPASPVPNATSSPPLIEIELVGGRRIRVGDTVDVDALRRIIAALEMPS